MKVETLTPVVAAAPGTRARWRLRVENDHPGPVGYRLRVIGFDPAHVVQPPPASPLAAGASDELDLELLIPEAFAAGHHSIAVEVVPDRTGVAPVIAAVTVTVGTIDDVALAVVPSTIRGHRRAGFRVDIDNRSRGTIDLELAGEGPDLEIRMRPDRVVLRPGERVRTSGRVKGPRHIFGEPRQHSMTVAARSRSAPSYAPATFTQRPLFPRGLRSLLAVLLIVGIWGGALGAGYLWWQSRDDATEEEASAPLVDTDGDGVPDTPGDQLIDTDGDGTPDKTAAQVAEEVASGGAQGEPQPGGSDVPTRTVLGGTVQSGDSGDPTGVGVTLTELSLGAPPPPGATPVGFASAAAIAGGSGTGKIWPARYGRYEPMVRSGVRQTESVQTIQTDERGAWFFGNVAVGQPYEVSFSRPGYDTQAFVVTPKGDGKPIELPVELKPSRGSVSGSVTGPGGPLGNVELVLTDGTLTFNSASASAAGAGGFSFTGVSTPGTYSLIATTRNFGTEVLQLTLEPGEQRGGVNIRMRAGVGSIRGRVTENGQPLGGVALTASNGDTTVETTSLTEGDTGSYTFPQLDIPGRYTVTASLAGYVTQTRVVDLNGNATGVDFDFVKSTGTIIGVVGSSSGPDLPGVNVRVSRDDLKFDTQTAVEPDPGSFTINDLPPGSYLIEFSRFDHAPASQQVTVAAGQVVDLGRIVLEFRPRPDVTQNGSLEVRVVDSAGNPLTGATVRLIRLSDESLVATQADTAGTQSSFVFQPLPIGTYRIEVNKGDTYRQATRRVSIGLGNSLEVITLFRLGQASGRLLDSFTGEELVDYDIQIIRINPDGSETIVQNIPVPPNAQPKPQPDGSLQIRWESAEASLTSGNYRVHVVNPTPGYRVIEDQVVQEGQPPMRFTISPIDDTPLRLADIKADRFPEIFGVAYAPQVVVGQPPFVAIDAPSLAVRLTCPGRDGVLNTVPAQTITDGVPGSLAAPDSFYFAPVQLEEADMFGACTLATSADGYVTQVIDVVVEAVRGVHSRIDRNVALFRPNEVGGFAYWVDRGVTSRDHIPADGVTVRPQGPVIVDFDPGDVPPTSAGFEPRPVTAPDPRRIPPVPAVAPVLTDAAGRWVFPDTLSTTPPGLHAKQVWGTASYVFERTAFQPRTVALTIDQAGQRAAANDPPRTPPLAPPEPDEVELDANGGRITASVAVRTIKSAPNLGGFRIDHTYDPTEPTESKTPTPNVVNPRLAETFFDTTDPGTHTVTVRSTATDVASGRPLFDPADPEQDDPAAPFQTPGAPVALPARTFVERGTLSVQVVGTALRPGPISGVVVSVAGGGIPTIPVTTGTALDNVVGGLPVALGPSGTTPYTITVTDRADLNLGAATVQVINDPGVPAPACPPPTSPCTVNIAQGGRPTVRITVPRFGTITGSVVGTGKSTGDEPLVPLFLPSGLPDPNGLVVTARRIGLPPTADGFCRLISPETPRPVIAVGNQYQFSGLEGYYSISVSHPGYEDTIPGAGPQQRVPEDQCLLLNPDGTSFPLQGRIFRMINDTDNPLSPTWRLRVKASTMTVTVRNDDLDVTPSPTTGAGQLVAGATVRVQGQGGNATDITLTTDSNGQVSFGGPNSLIPGAYTVTVGRVVDGAATHFPVSFTLSIPDGGAAVTLNVPLPQIGGSITGDVIAVNSEGDRVLDRVQVPDGVQVSDEYDVRDPRAIGATVGTAANPDGPSPVNAAAVPPPPEDPQRPPLSRYQFLNVGSGAHTLMFNDAGGAAYTPPASVPVTVLGLVDQPAPEAVYTAADRTVVVTVGVTEARARPDDAVVTLLEPDGDTVPAVTVSNCTGPTRGPLRTCSATFTGVAPELSNYRIRVTKNRYAPAEASFNVPPGDPATNIPQRVDIAGNVAHIIGFAEAQNTNTGSNVPLPSGSQVQLFRGTQTTPVQTKTPEANGSYFFDVTARDGYRVTVTTPVPPVTPPGYAPRSRTFVIDRPSSADGDLGEEVDLGTIVVPRLATFSITVTGAAPASAQIQVAPSAGTPTTPPTVAPAVTRTPGGFDVAVDPGAAYQFTITADGFLPLTIPASPQDPDVGGSIALTAAMVARTITGTITGATSGTVVRATNGTTVINGTLTDSTYTISPVPIGTWTVEAADFEVGRGVSTPQTIVASTGHLTGVNVTLAVRQWTINFTTTPGNTQVAITGGASGTATNGSLALPHPESSSSASWTATATGYITQTGSVTRPAEPSDPYWTTLSTTATITLVAFPAVTATVAQGTPPAAVVDAIVTLCPGGGTDACGRTSTGAIPMTFSSTTSVYGATVTATGDWRIGATNAAATLAATPVPFNVSSAGVITPTPPIALTLPVPAGP